MAAPAAADTGRRATFIAEESGVRLTVEIDGPRLVVVAANFGGARDEGARRVLERFSSLIIGKPLQEAADHGAVYTAASLPDDCAPVDGIRTPRNAGPAFALAERLIRDIHAAAMHRFATTSRDNNWYPGPSAAWLAKSEAEQAELIKPFVADALHGCGLAAEDAWISRIERGRRLTIAFVETVSYRLKPGLMMGLERRLRREMGEPLEIFMEDMKDANAIRRL
jgi:hypothetical protein